MACEVTERRTFFRRAGCESVGDTKPGFVAAPTGSTP
jgi:hypothetical protein